jgi:DNA-nicking Smr family endonuclease
VSTVFETLSDGFYTAFFEPDKEKRKENIETWIKTSIPIIQSAVENDLRAYIDEILESTWVEKGWKSRVEKFIGQYQGISQKHAEKSPLFIDNYRLYLDVKLRTHTPRDKDISVDVLTPEVRAKTNEAAEVAKNAIAKLEPPKPIDLREIDVHGNYVDAAIPIIEKFLTDCYRDNVRKIRIIHGKGIFVLQKAIREYLKRHEYIQSKSIISADKDHGGEGATEASLIDFDIEKLN